MYQIATRPSGVSLLSLLPQCRIIGARDICTTSCSSDWQQCEPGDLFVAIDTDQRDGHQDAIRAIERGATAVLAERLLPVDAPICLVDDTRHAFSQVCQGLAGDPSQQLNLIGVTGTHGKTVTAHLIHGVLAAAEIKTGLISSSTIYDGDSVSAGDDLGPTPPQIAGHLAKMTSNEFSAGIVEMGSRSLAQRHWAGVRLNTAVITNLRCDHLDFHGTQANYHLAKRRILDLLSGEGMTIFDADDQTLSDLMDGFVGPSISVSTEGDGELNAYLIERHPSEQTILLQTSDQSIPVRTSMIGDAHTKSILLAAATGLSLGIDLPTIAKGIEGVGHLPGRMERVECGQSFTVMIDRARTPDQLAETLKTLRQVTRGRLTCVFGVKHDRPADERSQMGRVAERYADRSIITSDDPDHESPLELAHGVLDGFDRVSRGHVLPDRFEAIRYAIQTSKEGDTIVVAGKGDDLTQRIAGTNWVFDDRETCRRLLYDSAAEDVDRSSASGGDDPTIYRIDDYRDGHHPPN